MVAIGLKAQETALDKISKETCEYLKTLDLNSLPPTERNAKLGVKIFQLYSKYEKELNEEGVKFDLSKGSSEGRDFGKKVGMNMVKFCPETLVALANDETKKLEKLEEQEFYIQGTIEKLEGNEFSFLVIRDEEGKKHKFLWLNNFKGSSELISSEKIKRRKVLVSYTNFECYSPKLREYISRKKITELEFVN